MIPKSKTVRVLALLLSLTLAVTVLCGAAYAEDIEIEVEPADTETGTDLWDIPIWNPCPDEIVMDVDTEEPTEPEADYEINVDAPSWWVNEPMDIIVYLDDIYDSGWERIEAACDYDADERTDLTEQFWDSGYARYTVSENGTVYFFITDLTGVEHIREYYVDFFDYCGPMISAGISGNLLHVVAYDSQSAVTAIYVNDLLYSTLENGMLDLRIDTDTGNTEFFVYAVDALGNRSETVCIANPFYQEPKEDKPSEPQEVIIRVDNPSGGNTGSAGTSTTPKAAEKTDVPAETEPVTIQKGDGFTENGIAATRDLLYDKHTNKQFITVETRNGKTLYLIIDYDKPLDEDGERYETYFLNTVDEADLMALLGEEDAAPAKCTCTDKCEAGAVNTKCEVCKVNMSECTGKEKPAQTEPVVTPEPDTSADNTEPEKNNTGLMLVLVLVIAAGGGALYWFKFRKPKTDTKGHTDLDDYDFGDAEDDDDVEYETEDENESQAEREDT